MLKQSVTSPVFKYGLAFEDILLIPKKSEISSRSEINISSTLRNENFNLPIISSPMDTVTEANMASAMSLVGGLGIVHRYNSIEDQVALVRDAVVNVASRAGLAVGVSGDFESRAAAGFDAGARIICIDVAHGHHSLVERAIKTLRDTFAEEICIIAGSVATAEGFADLSNWGADAVRVGVGGGSICSTRVQTGHGVPTFQSILACKYSEGDAKIIADGGIKTSGDIVKSLAAGADFVMLGSMLAGTDESPGEVFTSADNKSYKVYRGMASREAQKDWRGEPRSLEGISTTIPYKGPVTPILMELAQGIRSGLSYSGARSIKEFQDKVEFVIQTSAGQRESSTHILER